MMNVLSLVSYPFLPAKFGGPKAIAGLYNQLSKRVNLVCVTTKNNNPAEAGYAVLNTLSDSPLRYINIFYFFTLRKIIRHKNITHLLLEHPYYGWLGILLKKSTGVKLVVRSHNIEGLRWKTVGKWWWKILWRYEKYTHRQADYNFFIQEEDRAYGISHFKLAAEKCLTVDYGTDIEKMPSPEEKTNARLALIQRHSIPVNNRILLFNGSFNYLPNRNALEKIIFTINPQLAAQKHFAYTLLICGKGIPDNLLKQSFPHIVVAGLVEDITIYFKGADLFLNPTIEGGGIKTKIVEAIAYGTTVLSTASGATGMDKSVCGNKLQVIKDDQWEVFTTAIINQSPVNTVTPASYYEKYNWHLIAGRVHQFLLNH